MELKFRKVKLKQLLPIISFASLAATIVIAGLTISLNPTKQEVLLANQDIAEGETITQDMVVVKAINLGNLAANYLHQISLNTQAIRSISAGELIAKTLVTENQDARIPIRLNDLNPIAKAISVGDHIDIWATESEQGKSLQPQPVAFDAIVSAIEQNSNMAQTTTSVEVKIDPSYLEPLLASSGSNFQITLVLLETLADAQ